MNNTIWIVTTTPRIDTLVSTARTLGDTVAVLAVGDDELAQAIAAGDVDQVTHLNPHGTPAEAHATAVVAALADARVVLASQSPSDRVLLGAAAAQLGAEVILSPTQLNITEDSVVADRPVGGGIAQETIAVPGPVAVLLPGGAQLAPSLQAAPITTITSTPAAVELLETRQRQVALVDLASASRIIGVGRGLREREDLNLIESLAEASHAQIACSRPLAEGVPFFTKDRYIGVTGATVSPALYVAIGISGQLQHMVGVRGAGTIVAVNNDAAAPIISEADYTIVGDLYEIVPALTRAFA